MIDMPIEEFTAEEAVDAGLIDAIKSGVTKIAGSYELTPDGFLNFKQKPFTFKDKFGSLRCGKFKEYFHDISEITLFASLFIEATIANSSNNDENNHQ